MILSFFFFRITRNTTSATTTTPPRLVTTTELTYVDTTAVAGKTYQYLVKSYNGGYSGYSAGKTVTAK